MGDYLILLNERRKEAETPLAAMDAISELVREATEQGEHRKRVSVVYRGKCWLGQVPARYAYNKLEALTRT